MRKMNPRIDKIDIQPIIEVQAGNKVFAKALEQWNPAELAVGLIQYIHFNSILGSGVANLAGEISRRQDLFLDPKESFPMIADRSSEVAAKIFHSALDEFGRKKIYRAMAQETFRAIAKFHGFSAKEVTVAKPTEEAMNKVTQGYCLNQTADERELLRAIGFHMGSRILANEEFNTIDRVLHAKHPNLIKWLNDVHAYTWIQVHTTVEADHFESALQAANLALKYFAGSVTDMKAKTWIIGGFIQFAVVQAEFMHSLSRIRLERPHAPQAHPSLLQGAPQTNSQTNHYRQPA